MNEKDFLSEGKHDREEEYFRRREQELLEKLRREAASGSRTDDRTARMEPAEVVKPTEPPAQISWGRRVAAIAAIASLLGVIAAWILMTA